MFKKALLIFMEEMLLTGIVNVYLEK